MVYHVGRVDAGFLTFRKLKILAGAGGSDVTTFGAAIVSAFVSATSSRETYSAWTIPAHRFIDSVTRERFFFVFPFGENTLFICSCPQRRIC